jgi:two-component system, NtrC family, sensor kinase
MDDINILIVDDEEAVRTVLARYMTEAGYRPVAVDGAEAARKELRTGRFDLLLCDMNMPGESGLELIRYVKNAYPEMGRVMVAAMTSSEDTGKIMEVGVYGYIVKPFTRNTLLITVENSLQHLRLDLAMQAHKKALEAEVWGRTAKLKTIMDNLRIGVLLVDQELQLVELNQQMIRWFPDADPSQKRTCYHTFFGPQQQRPCEDCPMVATLQKGETVEITRQIETVQGERDFRIVTSPIHDTMGNVVAGIALYDDITDKIVLEQELRQAQKIEAIGQLAAGIAHEINTPIQYVGDNLVFLKDAFSDISQVLDAYHNLYTTVKAGTAVPEEIIKAVEEAVVTADLEYLTEEIPTTVDQGLEGVHRIEKIVRSMKEFSHPGTDEKTNADINAILESTLTICRNQWKYVAELETDLQADLPLVSCLSGEISQVFLNLIVNAAHAIGDATQNGLKGLGKITITTREKEGGVRIRIGDTGGGVPEAIQDRIFDQFFTTKERGKGTGQGLAIARRVIEDSHAGSISFETEPGKGTTFIIELPL